MTPDEQLDLWLRGESVHNPTTDECCPDFSCCCPDLKQSDEDRARYYAHIKDREAGRLRPPKCAGCGNEDDLRFGYCFDCASAGELRAAKRTVLQHLRQAWRNIRKGSGNWKYDARWALERATRTGNYAPGGAFETEYGIRLSKEDQP
jgi:hypothetical protein